jgi:hypothetical protein
VTGQQPTKTLGECRDNWTSVEPNGTSSEWHIYRTLHLWVDYLPDSYRPTDCCRLHRLTQSPFSVIHSSRTIDVEQQKTFRTVVWRDHTSPDTKAIFGQKFRICLERPSYLIACSRGAAIPNAWHVGFYSSPICALYSRVPASQSNPFLNVGYGVVREGCFPFANAVFYVYFCSLSVGRQQCVRSLKCVHAQSNGIRHLRTARYCNRQLEYTIVFFPRYLGWRLSDRRPENEWHKRQTMALYILVLVDKAQSWMPMRILDIYYIHPVESKGSIIIYSHTASCKNVSCMYQVWCPDACDTVRRR